MFLLCPICKKNRIKFYGSAQIGFSQTCSKQCRDILWKNNQIKTIQNLYGVDNVWKNEKIKQKFKNQIYRNLGMHIILPLLQKEKNIRK